MLEIHALFHQRIPSIVWSRYLLLLNRDRLVRCSSWLSEQIKFCQNSTLKRSKKVSTRSKPCKPILLARSSIRRKTGIPPIRWSLRCDMTGEFRTLDDQIAAPKRESSVPFTVDSISDMVRCWADAQGARNLGIVGGVALRLGHLRRRRTGGFAHRGCLCVRRRLVGQ